MMMKSLFSTSIAVLVLAFIGCSRAPEPAAVEPAVFAAPSVEPADFVFTNGKVYTVDSSSPWAEVVAVKGNKIVYVGDDTEVLDVAGKMVMPGFISTHDHLITSGWTNLGVQLHDGKSLDDYLNAIQEYADAHPDEKVIRGMGWNAENIDGDPTAEMLDRAVPDRPVIVIDTNLLVIDPTDISEAKVELTMMDGVIRYQAA